MPRKSKRDQLKRELSELGLTAVELAHQAGVHPNTVYKDMKAGQLRPAVAQALAAAKRGGKVPVAHAALAHAAPRTNGAKPKERVEAPTGPAERPLVFEHREPSEDENEYQRVAKRVIDAVEEMNKALQEAHQRADMRVFLGSHRGGDGGAEPLQFGYNIYKLTNSVVQFSVTLKEPAWREIKDSRFRDAAGEGGFASLGRKHNRAEGAAAAH